MEGQDEVMNNNNNNNIIIESSSQLIMKGKRTKRQRPQSPIPIPIPFKMIDNNNNNSSKSEEGSDICSNYYNQEISSTTEEEEDMANCLILLSHGQSRHPDPPQQPPQQPPYKFKSRKFMEANTTEKSGFYVYECKTCSKTFSSFQALGGHRASHKKPKINKDDDKNRSNSTLMISKSYMMNLVMSSDEEDITPNFKSINGNNNGDSNNQQIISKPRVHECSICGAEFSSGQALGGHMRRHRAPPPPMAVVNTVEEESPMKNPRKDILSLDLDLNLPAPIADEQQHQLVFSSPVLVDCHY